jgi:hypothetical protein
VKQRHIEVNLKFILSTKSSLDLSGRLSIAHMLLVLDWRTDDVVFLPRASTRGFHLRRRVLHLARLAVRLYSLWPPNNVFPEVRTQPW